MVIVVDVDLVDVVEGDEAVIVKASVGSDSVLISEYSEYIIADNNSARGVQCSSITPLRWNGMERMQLMSRYQFRNSKQKSSSAVDQLALPNCLRDHTSSVALYALSAYKYDDMRCRSL
jgi:hypothetical protein